jgi:hypothetical protein
MSDVNRSERRWDFVVCAFVVALTFAHLAYYFPRVVDDLFISLKYAENLARGNGAVFNVGERVEGYSSPAWMLLQALGIKLGIEGVTWTKVLGVASLLATELGLFLLARRSFGIRGALAWLPSACLAANSYVVNWTVLGLETPFHLATLVLFPVALEHYLERPSRGTGLVAGVAMTALAMARPESPMYLVIILASQLARGRSRAEWTQLIRALAKVAVPVGALLVVLLIVRRTYYGYFVPNTYFVKGTGVQFDLRRAGALWTYGVNFWESVAYVGGLVLLVPFGLRRRSWAPALISLACIYFTASVTTDWMPSLRHLLPVTVLAPLGWAAAADAIGSSERLSWGRLAFVFPVLVLVLASIWIAGVDNRFSVIESANRSSVMRKTVAKWHDVVLAYRRVEPPHVRRMDGYNMGQISQAWGVLDTSAEPVDQCWFAGRDIGAVGYYTGVRIFDTAGLLTPLVSHSTAFIEKKIVTDDLAIAMMSHHPIAGEIYDGWEVALGRHPELLHGYRLRFGTPRYPNAWVASDRTPPTREELVRRYEAVAAKFPRRYHLQTLYGETVGAVIEKRLRVVRGS